MSSPVRTPVTPGSAAVAQPAARPDRPARPPSRRALWVARGLLVLVPIIVLLVGLEVALRMFGPILPGNYTSGPYLERHPDYGFFHVPNYVGWQRSTEYFAWVRFNRLGLRDPRDSYAKPPNTFRILLLGDSFMEAVQVDQSQTTAALLEERLRRARPELNVEVVNAGVAGWSTSLEYLYLDREGYKFEPDLVVLAFFVGNDLHDNHYKLQLKEGGLDQAVKPFFLPTPDGGLDMIPPPPPRSGPSPVVAALRACCRLYSVFETGVLNRLGDGQGNVPLFAAAPLAPDIAGLYESAPSGEWQTGWTITERLLARIRERAASIGAPLAVFAIPDSVQLDDRTWRRDRDIQRDRRFREGLLNIAAPNRHLAEIAARQEFPFLDLLSAFRAASDGEWRRYYFETDQHWNGAAHALAAEELEGFLAERGLFPRAP